MGDKPKRLTISDIAAMAGTSKTTVSFYLNGRHDKIGSKTIEKIGRIIEETGYKPSPLARSLNAKSSKLIGVIVGDITNAFSNQVIKGISQVARKAGYHLVASASNYDPDDEAGYVREFISLGVDGFIVQPTASFKQLSNRIKQTGKPLVFFDSKLYDFSNSWVKTDNYNATYTAIKQAIERGYKSFAIISAETELLSTRIERFSGFKDALESESLTWEHHTIAPETLAVDDIRAFIAGYLDTHVVDKDHPALIFAPNCWSLPTIYEALNPFFDRLPYLGLLGLDNSEWVSVASPAVSTIAQPAFEEGRIACQILLDQIADRDTQTHQEIPCTITWRDTTL